jgi:hypothetical protein
MTDTSELPRIITDERHPNFGNVLQGLLLGDLLDFIQENELVEDFEEWARNKGYNEWEPDND